jgi:hypothetical protein
MRFPVTAPSNARSLEYWASQAGCTVETLRRAIRRKELLAVKEPLSRGPRYVVTPTDFQAFLEKRRAG